MKTPREKFLKDLDAMINTAEVQLGFNFYVEYANGDLYLASDKLTIDTNTPKKPHQTKENKTMTYDNEDFIQCPVCGSTLKQGVCPNPDCDN